MTYPVHVTEYDPASGRLLTTYSFPNEDHYEANKKPHQVGGVFSGDTHYILNGEPTERPPSPVTRADLTLHAVPDGATLFINGGSYAAEGTVELEFPMPGTYGLRIECFPFLDWTDKVTV